MTERMRHVPQQISIRPFIVRVRPGESPSVAAWLAKKNLDTVIDGPNNHPTAFPRLHGVWTEVKDLTLGEASAHLSERIWDTHEQASMFGIKIDERFAIIAGPTLLIAILLFMSMHLNFLFEVVMSMDPQTTKVFPWPLLFPGILSFITRILTIVLLPVAGAGAVILRGWGHGGALYGLWIAILLMILLVIVALGTLTSLSELVEKLRPDYRINLRSR
jgi:hypothetical protein